MRVIIGFEWSYQKKHWLHIAAERAGYLVEIVDAPSHSGSFLLKKFYKPLEVFNFAKLAHRAVKKAQQGDIFIGASFTSAVLAAIFDRKHDLTILGINILTHRNSSLAGSLRNVLYKKAFRHPRLYGTCNTQAALDIVAELFGEDIRGRFFILHDAMRFERRLEKYWLRFRIGSELINVRYLWFCKPKRNLSGATCGDE